MPALMLSFWADLVQAAPPHIPLCSGWSSARTSTSTATRPRKLVVSEASRESGEIVASSNASFGTLGARRAAIFRLVLMESLVLCFLGVAPGVIAGAGLAKAIRDRVTFSGAPVAGEVWQVTFDTLSKSLTVTQGMTLADVVAGLAALGGAALVAAPQSKIFHDDDQQGEPHRHVTPPSCPSGPRPPSPWGRWPAR